MRENKKARLEAAGWHAGSVQEFLGLSDEELAYVELRVRLSEALRRRRHQHGLSQSALAARLQSSQSRVAKMEVADPSVSLDLLIRSLLALGVSTRELGRELASAPRASPVRRRARPACAPRP